MNPWCTVIIPMFNGARYLGPLLSSLSQSSDEQCPCLFIDDASIDGSIDMVMASRLPGMRVIRNEQNLGLYATINVALNHIQTDYVSLLFQDDVLEGTYFRQMKRLAETHRDISFLWAAISTIDINGRERAKGLDTGRVEVIPAGVHTWRGAVQRGTFWTISGSVSKTRRLRYHGFREDLPHCADYDFLLRAIREDPFLYFERPLINIRVHADQASARHLAKSADFLERMMIYRDQKSRFSQDFDLSLRWSTCRREVGDATRRGLAQALRGNLRQACSTAMLLPDIIRALMF